jgi:hypothetical protein
MTTTFQNFVCWRDDAVLAVTPRDAASLSDGQFQAIHHPLRLRRRRLDQRSGGTWATEADALEAFKGRLRPDGYLFIPIVGGSGTGKSHLVRWMKDQTQNEPRWEVRYLPKNRTGLRRAIEVVIRGLTGPRIEEAREALEAAPSHTESDDILAERLLDELALLVSLTSTEAEPPVNRRAAQMRKKLSHELPDLLRDPVVRRKLIADGAVIQRLVGLALRGREEGDGLDDDATRFMESDFPLTFEEIGHASKGARELLSRFATLSEYKNAAVAMINEVLPAAEKHVTVSNQVDLVEVFREVRRALHSDGKELALFVEDLTVLHGVEREFLDAIVEPVHSEDGDMCGLRMIFAVTEGHFDDLDTVRTRCDDAYWFDTPYGEDGVDEDEALSFIARYLNAARLDPVEIDAAWTGRDSDNGWLRNACHTCVYREQCHVAFGTSREGYGLYPLDAQAAGRFVRALSTQRFDPRDAVREVVNRFLLQGSRELQRNEFPSPSTLAAFDPTGEPLPPLVTTHVKNLRPVDHDRVSNILRYWASPDSPADISTTILEAFGVEAFVDGLQSLRTLLDSGGDREETPRREQKSGRGSTRGGIEDRLKTEPKKKFAELTAWASGQREMSASTTRDLRQAVHRLIKSNLELGSLPVNLGAGFDESRFRDIDIVFAGTVTQQMPTDKAYVVIDRSQDGAAVLQALILAKELDSEDWPQASTYRRMLATAVETWTATVVARLCRPVAESTTAIVQGAIVASAVLGDLGRGPSLTAYMSATFASPRNLNPPAGRSAKWTALVTRAAELKPRLQERIEAEFGEARGVVGGVRMVQADRLLPIVKDFMASWRLDSTTDSTIAGFFRLVEPAIDAEWAALEKRVIATQPLIDRDRTWEEQTAKVLTSLRMAHQAGRLPDSNAVGELTRLANYDPQQALRAFHTAVDALAKTSTLPDKLTLVASDIPELVTVVHDFAGRAAKAIDTVERDLVARQTGNSGATDLEKAATRVLGATNRFDDAVKGLMR